MANISDFKSRLLGGGARANQFRVELAFPSFVNAAAAGQQVEFLCKAASLPASQVENVQVQYRGRPVNFAGERTFQPWNVTVIQDTSFAIRNALEEWQSGIQNYTGTDGRTNPIEYQVDLLVHQLDRAGTIIKTYKFFDAYPTNIGEIQVSFDNANQIEEFTCEFTYNYFASPSGATV